MRTIDKHKPKTVLTRRDVKDCHQRFSGAFDLLLIFLYSLISTLTLTPHPNNALLGNLDMYDH